MIKESIKHFCFDKDGIIINVHAYWHYTCQLRAEYLTNNLNLDPSLIGQLLWAMGIDPKPRQIRKDGPVGYNPRNVVMLYSKKEMTIRFNS